MAQVWWRNRPPFMFLVGLIALLVHVVDSTLPNAPFGPPRKQVCEHYVSFQAPESTNQLPIQNGSSSPVKYEYVDSSKECDTDLGTEWQSYRQCKETEISLALYTDTIQPIGNFLPYIRLNMSATVMEPANTVWFVYNCVHAPDGEDKYCHNRGDILPCRGIRLEDRKETTPFRADVLCFKMFGLSQYQLDVIVKPQQCRASIYATMPNETKFDPRIHQFLAVDPYNASLLNYEEWSPFLFVETHPEDGVWVRFEYPVPLSRVLEINFALYKQTNEGQIQYVRDEVVRLPNTGFKWIDLDAGAYIIYAYVQRAHCRLICSNDAGTLNEPVNSTFSKSSTCSTCPYTMLNFTLPTNKFTASWQRTRTLIAVAKVLAVSVLILLLIVGAGLISVVGYLRYLRPRRLQRRPPQNFELTAQPKLLILYTDDCTAHSECVLQLAHFLVANASARVYMDLWDLNDPTVRATNWLVNKMESVDFVLVVFSDGSRRVMEGERMTEQRPFPDLFNPALRIIVSKITSIISRVPTFDRSPVNNSTQQSLNNHRQNGISNGNANSSQLAKEQLKRFVIVRFNYTRPEAVAEFFPHMGCSCYQIPEDLPRLVGHLHRVETGYNSHLEFAADHQQLNGAIQAFKNYRAQHPNYLEERFSSNLPQQVGVDQLTGLVLANPDLPEKGVRTDAEMLQLIEKYGLEAESDEQQANGTAQNQIGYANSDHRLDEAFPLVADDESTTSEDENG